MSSKHWVSLLTVAFCGAPSYAEVAPPAATTAAQAFAQGNFERAATFDFKAVTDAQRTGQTGPQIRALVQLSQSQAALGQWDLAMASMQKALVLANQTQKVDDSILVQSNLGSLYVQMNNYSLAERYLNNALTAAQNAGDQHSAAQILNDIGNLRGLQDMTTEATTSYAQSAQLAKTLDDNSLLSRVSVNQAILATNAGDVAAASAFLATAEDATTHLTGAQHIELLASIGDADLTLSDRTENTAATKAQQIAAARRLFETARSEAEKLGDVRLQSLTIGSLGEVAETEGQNATGMKLTRQARFFAQQANAAYLSYRWEWQLGRLLKASGNLDDAIASYQRAIATFRTLCNCGGAPALSGYQAVVRPLYYQLADALLRRSSTTDDPRQVQVLLKETRDILELFKTAELSNYFQDDCVSNGLAKTKDISLVLNKAAVVYFVPLADRTEILVEFSTGLQRFTAPITSSALMSRARRLRLQLQRPGSDDYMSYSRGLYDLLIRPIEPTLQEKGVDTLVFVLDSALRTIPMAALNDGQSFLIEKYQMAVAPAVTLIDPRPLSDRTIHVFAGGLSESVQGFDALASVPQELNSIKASYPVTTLLNRQFVRSKIDEQISDGSYSIVHIASHGEFGSQASSTYLLTYDSKVTLNELENLIRPRQFRGTPVELLVLSACQTAAGDDRAALGLAGVAVKAGARSALASLWSVNDEATSELVRLFYADLKQHPGISKAGALRDAQLQLLKDERFQHPSFWAPYLIIGNWL